MNLGRGRTLVAAGWTVARLDRSLGAYSATWDRLNALAFDNHPLLHSGFVNQLLRQFGRGDEILAFRGPPELASAMCVMAPHRAVAWRSFVPSQAQISPTLIASGDQLDGLIDALPGPVLQVDLLCIDPRLSELWTSTSLSIACAAHAVTIGIDLSAGFETWWERRPHQLRKNLRKHEKRAEVDGLSFRLQVATDPSQVEAAVCRYAALEGKGWKGAAGTALASSDTQLRFYIELLTSAAATGDACVYELWAGDRLAASRLLLRRSRWIVILKTTFDESMRDYAPGRVLLLHLVRDAFKRWPDACLEFYTNASKDQLGWVDDQRTIQHFTIHRNRGVGWIKALAGRFRRRDASGTSVELSVEATTMRVDEEPDADTRHLFEACEQVHFQLGLDWWRLYASTVMATSPGVRFLALKRGGRTLAVLPANVDRQVHSVGGMIGALANFYSALFGIVHVPDLTGPDLVPLIKQLTREAPKGSILRFEPLDPDSPSFRILETALRGAGLIVFRYVCSGNWYLPVVCDWDRYSQSRPSSLRNTLKRMRSRLDAAGARIEIVASEGGLATALQAFGDVYSRSWKRLEPVPTFVPALAELAARRGWLRLGLVWLDNRPIAAQLWIVADGRASIYKLAYDKDYRHLGCGTVLTAELMRHAIEIDRVREIDYMAGDEPYKRDWMTHRRERCGLEAYQLGTLRGFVGALRSLLGTAWRYPTVLTRRNRLARAGDRDTSNHPVS